MTDVLSLKKANCKNCHKCIRVCPVKSIRFADNQAKIINQDCILCGRCVVTCPQNAKKVRNDLTEVIGAIGSGKKVVASVAPSFISEFPVDGIGQFETLLKKLGFFAVRETAEGAYIVKREYERMIREHQQEVIISSCCPSGCAAVRRTGHLPDARQRAPDQGGIPGCVCCVYRPVYLQEGGDAQAARLHRLCTDL